MKIGDLVRRKGEGWLALIIKSDRLLDDVYPEGCQFPEIMWLDTGEIDSCAASLLEIVNEER